MDGLPTDAKIVYLIMIQGTGCTTLGVVVGLATGKGLVSTRH